MLLTDAVGSLAVPVQHPTPHVSSSLLQDERETAVFALRHLHSSTLLLSAGLASC